MQLHRLITSLYFYFQNQPKGTQMNTSNLADQTNSVIDQTSHAIDQAGDLTKRGVQAVREGGQQLREKAQSMGETTVDYIQQEPVKAMLIAAATGAALMAMLNLINRSGHRN